MNILNPSGLAPSVYPVSGFEMRVAKEPWPYADEHSDEIASAWEESTRKNPALFNGRVLVALDLAVLAGQVRATFVEIPFAALLYWRSQGFPREAAAWNTFGSAVVVSRDGAVLVAEMGAQTANAGRIYFPAGTPDLSDVQGDRLDIDGSIVRELAEETGIGADVGNPSGQRWAILDRPLVCCARRIDVNLDGEALLKRVNRFLALEKEPELAAVRLVRSRADIDPERMPAFVCALLGELVPA